MSAIADSTARQVVVGEHESLARQSVRRFLRHRLAIVGLLVLTTIFAVAILLPLVAPLDPTRTDYGAIRQPPGPEHILGADLSGRDVWSRVVHGTRISLIVGFGAVGLYIVIGTVLGLLAGFGGGLADQLIMRTTDTVLAIPLILLCIVFISVVGPGLLSVIVVIALLGWPQTTRIVRGQLLALREEEFITASRVLGVADREIVARHLLPNIFGPLTVVATFGVAQAILLEAALSFLGLGVRPPDPSLGEMVNAARAPSTLQGLPWVWLPPGIVIALLVLAVNFIGDGVRDAIDPRSTRRA
ncbi:MAG TPA: ABC transporter permease [Candidatus Limnocylindrales bacterium]|jgi:peptide/nickel transport system permease protein|nr:ABC transporter permease [Candidatus Limnocylindrales bacterium]